MASPISKSEPLELEASETESQATEESFESQSIAPEDHGSAPMDVDEEEEPQFAVRSPPFHKGFIFNHPRAILAFLRFLDIHNETAVPDERVMLPAIPSHVLALILRQPFMTETTEETAADVAELKEKLERYKDTSYTVQELDD